MLQKSQNSYGLHCRDKKVIFDFTELVDFDTHGMLLIIEAIEKLEAQKCHIEKKERVRSSSSYIKFVLLISQKI